MPSISYNKSVVKHQFLTKFATAVNLENLFFKSTKLHEKCPSKEFFLVRIFP